MNNFSNEIARVELILPTSITTRIDCGCAGENSLVWFGPRPAVTITDPEMIKEIMSKNYVFQKASGNPMAKMLARGVATYETEKWAKHRKLINPAFHLEKLKVHDLHHIYIDVRIFKKIFITFIIHICL